MSDRKDVWVVLESSGDDASAINSALLLEGSRIASGLGGALSALAVGWMCDELSFFEQYDLACLFHLQGEELTDYQSENHTWAISSFVRGARPPDCFCSHRPTGAANWRPALQPVWTRRQQSMFRP